LYHLFIMFGDAWSFKKLFGIISFRFILYFHLIWKGDKINTSNCNSL